MPRPTPWFARVGCIRRAPARRRREVRTYDDAVISRRRRAALLVAVAGPRRPHRRRRWRHRGGEGRSRHRHRGGRGARHGHRQGDRDAERDQRRRVAELRVRDGPAGPRRPGAAAHRLAAARRHCARRWRRRRAASAGTSGAIGGRLSAHAQADAPAARAFARARRAARRITDPPLRRQALAAVQASQSQYRAARSGPTAPPPSSSRLRQPGRRRVGPVVRPARADPGRGRGRAAHGRRRSSSARRSPARCRWRRPPGVVGAGDAGSLSTSSPRAAGPGRRAARRQRLVGLGRRVLAAGPAGQQRPAARDRDRRVDAVARPPRSTRPTCCWSSAGVPATRRARRGAGRHVRRRSRRRSTRRRRSPPAAA